MNRRRQFIVFNLLAPTPEQKDSAVRDCGSPFEDDEA